MYKTVNTDNTAQIELFEKHMDFYDRAAIAALSMNLFAIKSIEAFSIIWRVLVTIQYTWPRAMWYKVGKFTIDAMVSCRSYKAIMYYNGQTGDKPELRAYFNEVAMPLIANMK
jgi:hypothetical protein